jgi:hypothetical protein
MDKIQFCSHIVRISFAWCSFLVRLAQRRIHGQCVRNQGIFEPFFQNDLGYPIYYIYKSGDPAHD